MEIFNEIWGYVSYLIEMLLHIDKHLNEWFTQLGTGIYFLMFLIIFVETGLVIMPFLPGDSLLFALGALSASESSTLSVELMGAVLIIAAILGDFVNYHIGKYVGVRVFSMNSKFIKKEHLLKTQDFYNKHGGKTIIMARFIPIIRTFAPFVAGIGSMGYRKFVMYNIVGAVLWVVSFLTLGYLFGNLPVVKKNFTFVVFGIIIVSTLPVIIEWWKMKRASSVRAS